MTAAVFPQPSVLLSVEGHAVGTFLDRGIGLMGADLDLSEGTEVFAAAVEFALRNSTLNGTVCITMTIHDSSSFV